MDAIGVEETAAEVDLDRCIGCGLCVAACDFDAVALRRKPDAEKYIPPETVIDTFVAIGKERKLF